jgi:hypothetical protein
MVYGYGNGERRTKDEGIRKVHLAMAMRHGIIKELAIGQALQFLTKQSTKRQTQEVLATGKAMLALAPLPDSRPPPPPDVLPLVLAAFYFLRDSVSSEFIVIYESSLRLPAWKKFGSWSNFAIFRLCTLPVTC